MRDGRWSQCGTEASSAGHAAGLLDQGRAGRNPGRFGAELRKGGLAGGDPDGMWRDWERPRDGGVFLHPAVYGVQVGEEEAAAPPLFEDGDIVMIRDCADARAEGLAGAEAVVHSAGYDADQADPLLRSWYHHVMPEGRDTLEPFDESDLQATGRRVTVDEQRPAHLGVSAEGVNTESFTP
ncbi:hypothetical protein [Streptomyces sp. NPDC001250]|uniref:hypothetical protein n=1 Tax=Streptomyces sp. NPDC001250 TaxID=3154382 RepID=UPI003324821F